MGDTTVPLKRPQMCPMQKFGVLPRLLKIFWAGTMFWIKKNYVEESKKIIQWQNKVCNEWYNQTL